MTRDYSKGKIYKLVCNDTGLVYYGHTTYEYLSQRLAKHIQDYKRWMEGNRRYITAFKVIKNGNYSIILMQLYPCGSKAELKARERYYIENNECVNKHIPGRTKKEYYDSNRDKILEKKKAYRCKNQEKIYEKNKEYRQKNKEKIDDMKKEYYEANKDKIYQKIDCECGSKVCRNQLKRHYTSKKHQDYLNK